MMSSRRGLGRGLGALISTDAMQPAEVDSGTMEVPVTAISPNPLQPRRNWDDVAMRELAASIREHGLLQPLIVTRSGGDDAAPTYEIVAGERRWRAAKMAGSATVPVLVREATDRQKLEWALVENLQRSDLGPLEAASAYHALQAEFGLSQAQIAERVGKSRAAVANALRLLQMPEALKVALQAGDISEGHARALLGLPQAEAQVAALQTVRRRSLSVRQTEELVRRTLDRADRAAVSASGPEPEDEAWKVETQALEERFRSALGTKVSLTRSKRGGKLVIRFYSEEELQRIYDAIISEG